MTKGKKKSPHGRWCLAGCLVVIGLVGIVIVTSIILFKAATEPEPIVPKEAFALGEYPVFIALRLQEDDAAGRAWAARAMEKSEAGEDAAADYDKVSKSAGFSPFPIQVVLTGSVGETEKDDRFGCTISITRGGNLLAWMLRRMAGGMDGDDAKVTEHAGIPMMLSDDGETFAAPIGNSVIVASDTGIMTQLIDRHAEHSKGLVFDGKEAVPVELDADAVVKAAYARLDRNAPLVFVATNGDAGLNRLLARAVAASETEVPEATVKIAESALTGLACVAGYAKSIDAERTLLSVQAHYPLDADAVERNAAVEAFLKLLGGEQVTMQTSVKGDTSLLIIGTTILLRDAAVEESSPDKQ